jgi:hypothetical protein
VRAVAEHRGHHVIFLLFVDAVGGAAGTHRRPQRSSKLALHGVASVLTRCGSKRRCSGLNATVSGGAARPSTFVCSRWSSRATQTTAASCVLLLLFRLLLRGFSCIFSFRHVLGRSSYGIICCFRQHQGQAKKELPCDSSTG